MAYIKPSSDVEYELKAVVGRNQHLETIAISYDREAILKIVLAFLAIDNMPENTFSYTTLDTNDMRIVTVSYKKGYKEETYLTVCEFLRS